MKCWCFNEQQLEAALKAWLDRRAAASDLHTCDSISGHEVRAFLGSQEARERKLILDGMWDRQENAAITLPVVVATPTGTFNPRDDAQGRN
jgi:hypothetical protein